MMEIPLIQGRLLTTSDRSGDRELAAAMVSEYMANAVWPNRSPVGELFNHMGRPYQVVGVVGDVRHSGPIQGYVSTYYTPYTQRPRNQSFLVARVPTGPAAALGSIDAAIKSIDVPVMTHLGSTMDDLVSRNVTDQRYHAYLAVCFGFMAMLLSAAGVLGTAARAVTKRRRVIALQKALGAKEGALVWGVVASGARQAIVGTVIGFIVALAGARVVAGFLFGVTAADPITYVGGGFLIILVGIGASFVPAKRITAIDPMQVLKAE